MIVEGYIRAKSGCEFSNTFLKSVSNLFNLFKFKMGCFDWT